MPIGFSRRRFGRRGGGFRKRFREPVIWNRGTNAIASTAGSLNAAGVFLPNTINLTTLDERLTLRRLILDTDVVEDTASAVANVDILCGVAMYTIGAPNPDPQFLAPRDTETDWLDVWTAPVRRGATQIFSYEAWPQRIRDIRAMRKVDNTDQIAVAIKAINATTGVALADGVYRLRWTFSALFARTSR